MGCRNILNRRELGHDFCLQGRGTLVKASRPGSFRGRRTVEWIGRGTDELRSCDFDEEI